MELSTDSSRKWGILLAIGVGTFMTALDTSVANTVLPIIGKSFDEPITSVEWVITIYLLILSGLLLSFGRLGDMRGHKTIYLTGFGIFIAGSLFSGIAPNISSLIAFRGLQALGASMLAANSAAILTKSFPAQQRGQALGLQATMTYLGLTVGPSLGGWLTSIFSWRVVFYINVPVGLAFFWLGSRFIPGDRVNHPNEKFDFPGSMAFMLGLGTLLLALNKASEWGWTSSLVLILLFSSAVLLTAFIFIERLVENPMLDLNLFKQVQFSLTTASAILNYIGIYSSIFLMPYYLIQARGFTPAQTGLILTAQPLVMAVVAPISGSLSDRIGTRLPAAIGMIVLSTGLFFLSRLGAESNIQTIMLALAVVGFGTGTFISPNNSALMGSASHSRQGIAAGILATARNMGMVLGVGVAGAIFTTTLAHASTSLPGTNIIAQEQAIFKALQLSFLTASLITFWGVVTSIVRVTK